MKCVINDQVVLSRAPDGPLAAYIGAFARIAERAGIRRSIRFTGRFCSLRVSADGLNRRGSRYAASAPIIPSRYLRYRARRVRPCLRRCCRAQAPH